MTYALRHASPAKTRAEAVVVGVLQGAKGPELAPGGEDVEAAFGRRLRPLMATLGVTGKPGEVTRIPVGEELATSLLVLIGLGKTADADAVRRAAGAAARAVPNATSVALALPAGSTELVRAVVEGYQLGGYRYTTYKADTSNTDETPQAPATVTVLSEESRTQKAKDAFETAQLEAAAVATIRDWVNTPPADLTPPVFADLVAAAADGVDHVTVTIHDEVALAELGCGGILGVGAGSAAAPRLVELTYTPADPVAHIALVGKGITFDSGGYTLKPGSSMSSMKSDMAGAATVVQATLVAAALGLPVAISTFAPMAENMISGSAMRPGDVLRIYGGTTVEVSNTDAEGRLVLADALVRATEVEPDTIIDVATLTGAMIVALGDKITGVMGSDATVADVLAAAERAGEPMWPMPIPEPIVERVHSSKVADLAQHDWIRWGGGLYAAAFLQEFTAGLPWAHLDIAGPSWHGGSASGHLTTGGTGAALTTLVEYIRTLSAKM
ncbi:leucyl aminopeptidase [Nocardioides sp.]|uniref:leucyl aminopeptidase n=1 Tax=Nocardioides sp. TaxID=35761 RepID=UPI002639BCCF|nr:leucyl aminopeptidase [Nocardioides sp.]